LRLRAATGLALLAGLACCGCADDKYYLIGFGVVGPKSHFEGRSISIQGRQVVPKPTDEGNVSASLGLCTASWDKFLNAPIEVVVKEGDRTLAQVQVQRVACKFGDRDARWEENSVFLDEDGRVIADFGDDPRVEASCTQIPSDCEREDL